LSTVILTLKIIKQLVEKFLEEKDIDKLMELALQQKDILHSKRAYLNSDSTPLQSIQLFS